MTRCPGTGHRFPLFWMETSVSQIVLWGAGARVGVNIEVVSRVVTEALEGRLSVLCGTWWGRGRERARDLGPYNLQLAEAFPHHCHTVSPTAPSGGRVARRFVRDRDSLRKTPLEEWPLRESPEGCRMPWATFAKTSLGSGCSMAFCSARTLQGWHWANCACIAFGEFCSPSRLAKGRFRKGSLT